MKALIYLLKLTKDVSHELLKFIGRQELCRVSEWAADSAVTFNDSHVATTDLIDADVVSSKLDNDVFPAFVPPGGTGDRHRPVLDIDFPAHLVESSTPGHYHLFLDKEMSWPEYAKLLLALQHAGVLQQGFVNASLQRGASHVRLPWVKK